MKEERLDGEIGLTSWEHEDVYDEPIGDTSVLLVLMLLCVCGDVGIFLVSSGSHRVVENPLIVLANDIETEFRWKG